MSNPFPERKLDKDGNPEETMNEYQARILNVPVEMIEKIKNELITEQMLKLLPDMKGDGFVLENGVLHTGLRLESIGD